MKARHVFKVLAGRLTYVERLYVYHYMPGSVVLWISLEWEPPESPLKFLGGEGRPYSTDVIAKKAEEYRTKVVVLDGYPTRSMVEELNDFGFKVIVRSDKALEIPEGNALLLHVSSSEELRRALKEYDDVHLEVYLPSESVLVEMPKDLPIHVFDFKLYSKLNKEYYYVYHHDYPLREDTRCPKCGTPNAVREMGRLIGWDGPKCRKCGFELHYHFEDLPKPPKGVSEWLLWQESVVVI